MLTYHPCNMWYSSSLHDQQCTCLSFACQNSLCVCVCVCVHVFMYAIGKSFWQIIGELTLRMTPWHSSRLSRVRQTRVVSLACILPLHILLMCRPSILQVSLQCLRIIRQRHFEMVCQYVIKRSCVIMKGEWWCKMGYITW